MDNVGKVRKLKNGNHSAVQCRKEKEGWERKGKKERRGKGRELRRVHQEYRFHIIYGPITRLIVFLPSHYSLSPFLLILRWPVLISSVLCSAVEGKVLGKKTQTQIHRALRYVMLL